MGRIRPDLIRYRGDREDLEELEREYRIGEFLNASAEKDRLSEIGVKEEFLKHGIRLTAKLSPRIFKIIRDVHQVLGITGEIEIFCLPSNEINAFAVLELRKDKTYSVIGITSQALELLNDDEIRFILGHEFGHFIFNNHRFNALYRQGGSPGPLTILPPMGEMIFLRWRKKAEISSDRVGFTACGDFRSCATALLKTAYGLSEKNLELNIDALMGQIDELKGKPELMEAEFASHPLLPLRLKALELFSSSMVKRTTGSKKKINPDMDALEDKVDELMNVTKRHPHKPLGIAVMEAVALGGIELLTADRDLDREEIGLLISILYRFFTDEPEVVINIPSDQRSERFSSAIDVINKEGEQNDKVFIISRYADIAMADGALMDVERDKIVEIGSKLQISDKIIYSILIGAAHTNGFNVDSKLNRISNSIKEALIRELKDKV